MPAKYSHVKKRSASGLLKKGGPNGHQVTKDAHHNHNRALAHLNPHIDRSISQAMTAVSQLERAIARVLLLRYEQDIARLFSTRLYSVALVHLPTFIMRCVSLGGPGWLAYNHDCDEIKDFFRAAISMDMRQAGERVATKSVLWSYTALRHFALSNNVPICTKRGLHSLRLLPYFPALKAHLDALEAMPRSTFSKPPHLGSLQEGQEALEDACELKYGRLGDITPAHPEWEGDWRRKVRYGYEKLSQTLWRVAKEFDVSGYGLVLREKLTTKWCDCGCSTDHLGEVCERTVREDEEESGVRLGKQREWDGRGSGVYGWETEEEEDIWEIDLDFGGLDSDELEDGVDSEMTIGEMMEWRYLKAEREKEQGNAAFRKGDYEIAVQHYEAAHQMEPELPHYQLNLAAAYLKLNKWMEAEKACTKALGQHQSSKGFYRRARARRMLGRNAEAIKDLRAILKLHPANSEAIVELASICPPPIFPPDPSQQSSTSSSSSSRQPDVRVESDAETLERLGFPKPKPAKKPPFMHTLADERKLKIVSMPGSDASHVHSSACAHVQRRQGKEKEKRSGKAKEMERMRLENVTYASWDRYIVKKVD